MKTASIVCSMCIILTILASREVQSDDISSHNHDKSLDKNQLLKNYCNTLCSSLSVCPRICQHAYQAPPSASKRAPGFLDGFTFDDYLFMRLLGRDMQGKRK